MTYQLPEPEYLGWDYERLLVKPIRGYTADQMQAAYQSGRDAMKAECVKAVDDAGGDNTAYHMNAMKELK